MFTKHAELLFEKEASVAFNKLKDILTGQQFKRGLRRFDDRKNSLRKMDDHFADKYFKTNKERWAAQDEMWNKINKAHPLPTKDIFGGAAKTTAAYALPLVGANKYLKSKDVDPFDPKNYQHLE